MYIYIFLNRFCTAVFKGLCHFTSGGQVLPSCVQIYTMTGVCALASCYASCQCSKTCKLCPDYARDLLPLFQIGLCVNSMKEVQWYWCMMKKSMGPQPTTLITINPGYRIEHMLFESSSCDFQGLMRLKESLDVVARAKYEKKLKLVLIWNLPSWAWSGSVDSQCGHQLCSYIFFFVTFSL